MLFKSEIKTYPFTKEGINAAFEHNYTNIDFRDLTLIINTIFSLMLLYMLFDPITLMTLNPAFSKMVITLV